MAVPFPLTRARRRKAAGSVKSDRKSMADVVKLGLFRWKINLHPNGRYATIDHSINTNDFAVRTEEPEQDGQREYGNGQNTQILYRGGNSTA